MVCTCWRDLGLDNTRYCELVRFGRRRFRTPIVREGAVAARAPAIGSTELQDLPLTTAVVHGCGWAWDLRLASPTRRLSMHTASRRFAMPAAQC